MVNNNDRFIEIEPKDKGTELAERFIDAPKERRKKEEEEREIKFKGKTLEIKPSGKIVVEKPAKLTKKELKSVEKKIRRLEKQERVKVKKADLFSKFGSKKQLKRKPISIEKGRRLLTFGAVSPQEARRELQLRGEVEQVPIRPFLDEFEKAIFDVESAAQPTIRDGFNQSVFVENSALATLAQSDREIRLIQDLLGGRL